MEKKKITQIVHETLVMNLQYIAVLPEFSSEQIKIQRIIGFNP
jgi:hypothetical protein